MDRAYEGERLDAMCDAIVERYHASLHETLPLIRHELDEIVSAGASPTLTVMRSAFTELTDQIESHLAKEENLLFPAIEALSSAKRAGGGRPAHPFSTVLHPIRLMEAEHLRIESALAQLRQCAREVGEPDTLVPAWGRCMIALRHLDEELHEQHRIENELLFPAALELERQLW